ncbi:MAG TPA: cytochrome c nitrite reductase small subunit [Gemmatimonadales bacterium]|nr:cytochrome c nitrite reductase small subunit [Gemmatimonadales bacterium]
MPNQGGVLLLAALVGVAAGTGGFTFWYGRGASYLTNDPAACANCHIMQSQYDGWLRSSHRAAATCNDCHTPHALPFKYVTKARNGLWHSIAFTTGRFPEPIRIKRGNLSVTERRCRECHDTTVQMIEGVAGAREPRACITCHGEVGHAR